MEHSRDFCSTDTGKLWTCVLTDSRGKKNIKAQSLPKGKQRLKDLLRGSSPKAQRAAISRGLVNQKSSPLSESSKKSWFCWAFWKLYSWTSPGMDCISNSWHPSDQIISSSKCHWKWSCAAGTPKDLAKANTNSLQRKALDFSLP